jgi:hypothetical protein
MSKRTMILQCSNMAQIDDQLRLSDDKSSFSFVLPGWMTNRDARVSLISSLVSNQDTATQTICMLPNVYTLQVRTNIITQSFSSEDRGSSSSLGSAFFPGGSRNSSINDGMTTDLGICQLPSEITIDRVQYDENGYVAPSSAFNVNYKLCPLSVTFLVEFLEAD